MAGMVFSFIPQHLSSFSFIPQHLSSSIPVPASTLRSTICLKSASNYPQQRWAPSGHVKCLKFIVILSLTLHRHCWNISSSLKTLLMTLQGREGQAGAEWSQLPLWPCWEHGKGALGVPEVTLSSGQCPLGCAVTARTQRPLNPRSAPAPGRSSPAQRGFGWGRTTLQG